MTIAAAWPPAAPSRGGCARLANFRRAPHRRRVTNSPAAISRIELDMMRKPDRQGAELQAALRRNELGVNGIAAFAVERLAGFQRALGDRHRVAAKAAAASGRLAAQRDIEHRDRQLQPDQMKRLVHRRITAARVGRQAVLLEAGRGVIVLRLEHDIDAPAQIALDRRAIALQRRHHFDHAVAFQHAANRVRPQHVRQLIGAAGRKYQAVVRHVEFAGVGDSRHLDRGFGAVEKRVEHLRVHAGRLGFRGREPVMLPHAVRRDRVIGRQIFGAFSGRGDGKACRARPVDHFRNQRRLIAIGHGIDHAGLARLAGEKAVRPARRPRH